MDSCCQSKREVSDGTPIPVGASEMTFRLQGMDCSEEVAAIERALKPISGVLGVRANLVALLGLVSASLHALSTRLTRLAKLAARPEPVVL